MSRNNADLNLGPTWVQVSEDGLPLCQVLVCGDLLPAVVRLSDTKPDDGIVDGFRLTALHPFFKEDDLKPGQKAWARAVGLTARVSIT